MKILRSIFLVLLLAFAAVGCTADPVVADSVGNILSGYVFPALASLGGVLALMAMQQFQKKTGIQLKKEQMQYVQNMAEEAVLYVTEIAAQKAKYSVKLHAGEKKQMAMTKLVSAVPTLSKTEADEAIHAALARIGEGASAVS
ncbi:MAG: hypothetical protein AB7E76_02760 [Deferribacterales bacterium]